MYCSPESSSSSLFSSGGVEVGGPSFWGYLMVVHVHSWSFDDVFMMSNGVTVGAGDGTWDS